MSDDRNREQQVAATRMAASWLLSYPDQQAYLPDNRLVDGTVHDW